MNSNLKKLSKTLTTCLFCASLLIQIGGAWRCFNPNCESHPDFPERSFPSQTYWHSGVVASGTASVASLSTISYFDSKDEGGD